MTATQFAVRSRRLDAGIYINKTDLLAWLADAQIAHEQTSHNDRAETIRDIIAGIQRVTP